MIRTRSVSYMLDSLLVWLCETIGIKLGVKNIVSILFHTKLWQRSLTLRYHYWYYADSSPGVTIMIAIINSRFIWHFIAWKHVHQLVSLVTSHYSHYLVTSSVRLMLHQYGCTIISIPLPSCRTSFGYGPSLILYDGIVIKWTIKNNECILLDIAWDQWSLLLRYDYWCYASSYYWCTILVAIIDFGCTINSMLSYHQITVSRYGHHHQLCACLVIRRYHHMIWIIIWLHHL